MKTEKLDFYGKTYTLIFTDKEKEFLPLLEKLEARPNDYLYGIDIETAPTPSYTKILKAGLYPHLSRPRTVQIATESSIVVFDVKEANLGIFKTFIESRRLVAHFAVFELQFFAKHIIKQRPTIDCTLLMAKLLVHATRPFDNVSLSLDALTKSLLGIDMPKGNQTSDWTGSLTWEQILYAGTDAIATRILYEMLQPKVEAKKLTRIYELVKKCQWPIIKMQLEGMIVDEKIYEKLIAKWGVELGKARNTLADELGFTKITPTTIANWLEANLDKETIALWPRTEKSGKLKTDANAFSEFSHLDIVKPILQYSKYEKLLSTYGQSLLDLRSPATGKLHTEFRLLGARTGRLSSSNPNFQNYPRDTEVRGAFIPGGLGRVFCVADYSQIEVRVAAEYSRDPRLLKIYADGLDVYKYTASAITGRGYKTVTKEERQLGKALLLGMLYGLGAKKFGHYAKKGYGVELSLDKSYKYVQAFRDTYSGYYAWQKEQAENAAQPPHIVTTKLGKKRKLDSENYYGASMNTPIQGTSAEIMMLALCLMQKSIDDGCPARLISNIHDEIICSAKLDDSVHVCETMVENMTKAFTAIFPNGITRDLVEVGRGGSWALAKGK